MYPGVLSGVLPWHLQIFPDQLTLSQPGGTDYAHLVTIGTLGFSDSPAALVLITYLGNVDLAVHKLFVLLGLSSLTCTKRPRKTLVMSSPTSIRWPDMDGLHLWFLSNTTRSLWKMLIGWTLPLFLIGILIISILASKPWKGATCWKLMVGLWNDPNTCWWEFLLVSFGVFSTRVWGTPCDLKAGKSRKQFFLKLHWPRTDLNFWHICPSL